MSTHPPTDEHTPDTQGECATSFFHHIAKQVGRKAFHLDLHVSPTLVDLWCTGERRDPFTAAKAAIDTVRAGKRADLIPAILEYMAGGFEQPKMSDILAEALKR